jgi:hypothetical protein
MIVNDNAVMEKYVSLLKKMNFIMKLCMDILCWEIPHSFDNIAFLLNF